jgi:hypothetical protein
MALVLILLFLWLQARGVHPMLLLGLFKDRNRTGSYTTMLLVGAGLMGIFYLLVLYLQQVLRFSPVWADVASLPFSAGISYCKHHFLYFFPLPHGPMRP